MNRIERQVLNMIGEDPDAPDAFSDITPIRDSINDAIQEVAMITGLEQKSYYLSLKADTIFYNLSMQTGEFAWIVNAFLTGTQIRLHQTTLKILSSENPRWMQYSGWPQKYFMVGIDKVGFHPRPSASTDVVEFNYIRIPKRYDTDTQNPLISPDYIRAVVHYAAGEYWASRGSAKEAYDHHAKYLEALNMNDLSPLSMDDTPYFKTEKDFKPKLS